MLFVFYISLHGSFRFSVPPARRNPSLIPEMTILLDLVSSLT